jgi:hypothetical protein
VVSFPKVSPPKPCTRLSPPHPSCMLRPSHFYRFYHPHNSGWGVQIIKLLIMKLSPLPCFLVRLGPKYSPQHPIFRHPQATFLSQSERQSFTPIQKIFKFLGIKLEPHRMVATSPWLQSTLKLPLISSWTSANNF